MAEHKKGAVAYYLIIALVLGAITYVEFAIVEYQNAMSWLTPFWIIVSLVVMSIVKFIMVVAIYMHLRDDDPIYTSFFSSGIVIAMGTFVALSFLFTVGSVANATKAQANSEALHGEEANHGEDKEHGGGHGEVHVEIEPEKTIAEAFRVPSVKDQSAVQVSLPTAPVAEYSLRLPGVAFAATDAAVAEESAVEASTDTSEAEPEMTAQASDFDWAELGETTYNANCLSCHQATGMGIPGAFPPLAGHMPELYNAEGGREYIINVVLYGLQGEINAAGTTYNSVMTPWAAILSDDQIAATLNHELTSWDNDTSLTDFSPILPEEVAAQRANELSSADVLGLRPELP